jgi:hypothetical protein
VPLLPSAEDRVKDDAHILDTPDDRDDAGGGTDARTNTELQSPSRRWPVSRSLQASNSRSADRTLASHPEQRARDRGQGPRQGQRNCEGK